MTAKDVAENAWLAVVARFSMIATFPALCVIAWLGVQWLDQRFEAQAQATNSVAGRVSSLEGDNLPTRISLLEAGIVQRGNARDQQIAQLVSAQIETSVKIDKMQDTINILATDMAALTATIKATSARN